MRLNPLQGYKVIGVDARKEPIQLAKDLKKNGADVLINADTTSVEEALKQIKQLDSEGLSGAYTHFKV
jgi:2-polyprenyl-3-methyl-5-hydroxy-6-metoxy-1,4-benzoquinol methylase